MSESDSSFSILEKVWTQADVENYFSLREMGTNRKVNCLCESLTKIVDVLNPPPSVERRVTKKRVPEFKNDSRFVVALVNIPTFRSLCDHPLLGEKSIQSNLNTFLGERFYCKIFFNDEVVFDEILSDHIDCNHVIIIQKGVKQSIPAVIAAASFYIYPGSGTILSWLAVSRGRDSVSSKDYRSQGFGLFLIMLVQEISAMAHKDRFAQLYCQINKTDQSAIDFWMTHWFYSSFDEELVPPTIRQALQDNSELELYKSFVLLQGIKVLFSDSKIRKDKNLKQILESGVKACFPKSVFSTIKDDLQPVSKELLLKLGQKEKNNPSSEISFVELPKKISGSFALTKPKSSTTDTETNFLQPGNFSITVNVLDKVCNWKDEKQIGYLIDPLIRNNDHLQYHADDTFLITISDLLFGHDNGDEKLYTLRVFLSVVYYLMSWADMSANDFYKGFPMTFKKVKDPFLRLLGLSFLIDTKKMERVHEFLKIKYIEITNDEDKITQFDMDLISKAFRLNIFCFSVFKTVQDENDQRWTYETIKLGSAGLTTKAMREESSTLLLFSYDYDFFCRFEFVSTKDSSKLSSKMNCNRFLIDDFLKSNERTTRGHSEKIWEQKSDIRYLNCPKCCFNNIDVMMDERDMTYLRRLAESKVWFDHSFIVTYAQMCAHTSHNKNYQFIPCREDPQYNPIPEECATLANENQSIIALGLSQGHFAVITIHPSEHTCFVFDGLPYSLSIWASSIIFLLKQSKYIELDEYPKFTGNQNKMKIKSSKATWLVNWNKSIKQTDGHSCGPIACLFFSQIMTNQDLKLGDLNPQQYRPLVIKKYIAMRKQCIKDFGEAKNHVIVHEEKDEQHDEADEAENLNNFETNPIQESLASKTIDKDTDIDEGKEEEKSIENLNNTESNPIQESLASKTIDKEKSNDNLENETIPETTLALREQEIESENLNDIPENNQLQTTTDNINIVNNATDQQSISNINLLEDRPFLASTELVQTDNEEKSNFSNAESEDDSDSDSEQHKTVDVVKKPPANIFTSSESENETSVSDKEQFQSQKDLSDDKQNEKNQALTVSIDEDIYVTQGGREQHMRKKKMSPIKPIQKPPRKKKRTSDEADIDIDWNITSDIDCSQIEISIIDLDDTSQKALKEKLMKRLRHNKQKEEIRLFPKEQQNYESAKIFTSQRLNNRYHFLMKQKKSSLAEASNNAAKTRIEAFYTSLLDEYRKEYTRQAILLPFKGITCIRKTDIEDKYEVVVDISPFDESTPNSVILRIDKAWIKANFDSQFLRDINLIHSNKDFIWLDAQKNKEKAHKDFILQNAEELRNPLNFQIEHNVTNSQLILSIEYSARWESKKGYFISTKPSSENWILKTRHTVSNEEFRHQSSQAYLRKKGVDPKLLFEIVDNARKTAEEKITNGSAFPIICKKTIKFPIDNVIVDFNAFQISAIKYDHSRNSFIGQYFQPNNERETCDLDEDWVELNFSTHFLKEVKRFGRMTKNKFVRVPLGKIDRRSATIDNHKDVPLCKFLQKDESTCCSSSLACALFFIGYQDAAESVYQFGRKYIKEKRNQSRVMINTLRYLFQDQLQNQEIETFRKKFYFSKITNSLKASILEEEATIRLVVLHAIDGSISHCVAIVNEWIFDSNEVYALPLHHNSLNRCCGGLKFVRIHSGYCIKFRSRKKIVET